MDDPESPTPVEKALIKMLHEHRPDGCMSAEELVELAEQGRRCPGYKARLQHVAICPGCFSLFRDLRYMEKARALAPTAPVSGTRKRSIRIWIYALAAIGVTAAICVELYRLTR